MSEWLDEPNRDEFEHSGLKCLIIRHEVLGHLCGYVGVTREHICFGKHYDSIPYDDLYPIFVHGGLTYCGEGNGEHRPLGYWWLGFDCAHFNDIVPYMYSTLGATHGSYKNFEYVRSETKWIADELRTIEFIDWQFKWVWPFLLPIRTARRIWER